MVLLTVGLHLALRHLFVAASSMTFLTQFTKNLFLLFLSVAGFFALRLGNTKGAPPDAAPLAREAAGGMSMSE